MPATKKHSRVRNGFGEVVDVDVIVADAVHLAGTQGYHTTNGHVFEGAGGESDTPPVDNPPFSGTQPVRTRATPPTGPAPAASRPSGQPSTSGASTWQSQSLRTLPVLARTGGARLRTQDGRRGRSATRSSIYPSRVTLTEKPPISGNVYTLANLASVTLSACSHPAPQRASVAPTELTFPT